MAEGYDVKIVNLPQFRAAIRASISGTTRELSAAIREAGRPVLERARQVAAKRTGRLAGSYYIKATTTQGSIMSRVAYGAGAEWGLHGKWSGFRRYPAFGTGAAAGRGRFAWRALVERGEEVRDLMYERLEDIVRIHGWAS